MTTIAASDATPAVGDAINFTTEDAPANTATGYNVDNYPASPAILYYISLDQSGNPNSLISQRFTPDEVDGTFTWPSVVVPSAGVWEANLRLDSDDTVVAATTITAS